MGLVMAGVQLATESRVGNGLYVLVLSIYKMWQPHPQACIVLPELDELSKLELPGVPITISGPCFVRLGGGVALL